VILRARVVLPISRPPLENGAVEITRNKVAAVGAWPSLRAGQGPVVDLGDRILAPGLVNGHCHLEYTRMAGRLPAAIPFVEWIQAIIASKQRWSDAVFQRSWLAGARMLLRHGVTSVADISAVPHLLEQVLPQSPLRVFSFLEVIGPDNKPPAVDLVRRARESIKALSTLPGSRGLSPHALYSTTPELMRACAALGRKHRWRLTSHVAESAAEFDMFRHGRGPLHAWLQSRRDMGDCGRRTPVQQLAQLGVLGPGFLAVHANYLTPSDINLLGESQAHVVHCPRSHAFFGHRPFPAAKLIRANVNLCLGTDSLASVKACSGLEPELDLFAEMRALVQAAPGLEPATVVRLATINGARALGWPGRIGELTPGAYADLIAIPYAGTPKEAYAALVNHTGPVSAAMTAGCWLPGFAN
jgi:cytosine/adenosine deaminase-related metal-dependent hydrolase